MFFDVVGVRELNSAFGKNASKNEFFIQIRGPL